MVEWLSAQPEQIRAAVLQHFLGRVKGDVARLIFKNMRGGRASSG